TSPTAAGGARCARAATTSTCSPPTPSSLCPAAPAPNRRSGWRCATACRSWLSATIATPRRTASNGRSRSPRSSTSWPRPWAERVARARMLKGRAREIRLKWVAVHPWHHGGVDYGTSDGPVRNQAHLRRPVALAGGRQAARAHRRGALREPVAQRSASARPGAAQRLALRIRRRARTWRDLLRAARYSLLAARRGRAGHHLRQHGAIGNRREGQPPRRPRSPRRSALSVEPPPRRGAQAGALRPRRRRRILDRRSRGGDGEGVPPRGRALRAAAAALAARRRRARHALHPGSRGFARGSLRRV